MEACQLLSNGNLDFSSPTIGINPPSFDKTRRSEPLFYLCIAPISFVIILNRQGINFLAHSKNLFKKTDKDFSPSQWTYSGSQMNKPQWANQPRASSDDWTDDFEMCISWLRSGISKTINRTPR
jgi:hypothetical protein